MSLKLEAPWSNEVRKGFLQMQVHVSLIHGTKIYFCLEAPKILMAALHRTSSDDAE